METENNTFLTDESKQKDGKRPDFLTVLCILTFIGSGISLLSQFFSFALYDTISGLFLQMGSTMGGEFEKIYTEAADLFVSMPRYYFIILALVYIISLTGAILMFKLRRIGFHIYVVSQLLLLGLPLLIIHASFNIFNLLFSLMFVLFYARFLKIMK